jgi:hypothetical protein
MQERHGSELADVVQPIGSHARFGVGIGAQAHASHGASSEYLHKFTLGQIHNFAAAYIKDAPKEFGLRKIGAID